MANRTGRVRPVPHLDLKNKAQATIQNPDQWDTGTIIGVTPSGKLEVSIDGAPDSLPTTIAPADSGVTAIGATVRLKRDSSGHIASVAVPDVMPDGETPVYLGATGGMILENAELSARLADTVEETAVELADARDRIAAAEVTVAEAATGISEAKEAAQDAKATADSMRGDVDLALTGTVSVDRLIVGTAVFNDAVIDQFTSQSAFIERLASSQLWTEVATVTGDAVIGGDLIVDGTIDVVKLRVTDELWAELLHVAGDASIGGELIGTNLTGKTITGSEIIGSYIRTAESGFRASMGTVSGDSSRPGFWIYDDTNQMRWTTQIVNAGNPATFFYDSSGAERIRLNETGLYFKTASGGRVIEILTNSDEGIKTFNDRGINFYGASESARYGIIGRNNDSEGSGLVLWGGSAGSSTWARIQLLAASDGAKISSDGIRSRTTASSANVFVGSTGSLARSTSVRKAKLGIQDQPANLKLLNVAYRSWIDKQEMIDAVLGRISPPEHRMVGAIAEEMVQVAPELVTYDPDGSMTGIAYDRVGIALIPIVRGLVNRIEVLEGVSVTVWPDSPTWDDTELIDEVTAYGAFEKEAPLSEEPASPPSVSEGEIDASDGTELPVKMEGAQP